MAEPKTKKPRIEPVDPFGPGGLYDFLPAPDPVKDKEAKVAATKREKLPLPAEDRSKVIFLDIDGVLLAAGSVDMVTVDGVTLPVRSRMNESDFKGAALDNLRSIVQQTGASIVLSSEWRRTEAMKNSIGVALRTRDLPQLRDGTPIYKPRPEFLDPKLKMDQAIVWCERRAREIGAWLKLHPDVTAWVALDDLDFSWADSVRVTGTPVMKYRSVLTHAVHCLSEEDAAKAVKMLMNPPALIVSEEQVQEAVAEAVRVTQEQLATAPSSGLRP